MAQHIVVTTALGDIMLELDNLRAPLTTDHFLRCVDAALFDNASFYRTVRAKDDPNPIKIGVIQGGLHATSGSPPPPIAHEDSATTGLSHAAGTISMAREAVGTADSEFFIVVEDSPALDAGGQRAPDGHGFAAFGRVVAGMAVVRTIWHRPIIADAALPGALLHPVPIHSIQRA